MADKLNVPPAAGAGSAGQTEDEQLPMSFHTSRGFQLFYSAPLLLVVLLFLDLLRSPSQEIGFIILLSLVVVAIALPRAWTRVVLDEDRLTVHTPLRKPRTLRLGQLVAVERSQRLGHALLLRYRPIDERGRLDIANELFLGLPPLENQQLLEERLQPAA